VDEGGILSGAVRDCCEESGYRTLTAVRGRWRASSADGDCVEVRPARADVAQWKTMLGASGWTMALAVVRHSCPQQCPQTDSETLSSTDM